MPGIRLKVDASSAAVAEKQMESAFSGISRAAKATEKTISKLNYGFSKIGSKFNNTLKSIGHHLFSLKSMFVGFATGYVGDKFLDIASSFEQMKIKLDALTQGRGQATLDKINKWAMDMPVNTQKAVDTFTMMKAMGLDPTIKSMQTLVDVATIFGEDAMPRVALALGQMKTLGRLSAQDLNQLSAVGINARKYLKESFGTADADKINKLGVSIDKIIKTITKGLKKDFGGAAKHAMSTWQGVKNQFKSIFTEIAKTLADSGVFKTLKESLKAINNELMDWLKTQKKLKKEGLPNFFDGVSNSVKKVKNTIIGVVDGFKILSNLKKPDLKSFKEFDNTNLKEFSSVAATAAINVLSLYQGILKIKEVIPSVKTIFKMPMAWANEKVGDLYDWIAKIIPSKELSKKYYEASIKSKQLAADNREELVKLDDQLRKIEEKYKDTQNVIDSLANRIKNVNSKIKSSFVDTQEEIKKVIRIINGKPITVYINTRPAEKALDHLENRVKHMKLSLNVNMTGTASSKKPLTEKIHDILDLYEKFPKEMQINADMTSLSGAYAAIQQIANQKIFLQDRISVMKYNDLYGPYKATSPRVYREMYTKLENYNKIISGIGELIKSGYYNAQGEYTTPYNNVINGTSQSSYTVPTTTKEAKVDIGPINITVSGTGGDRDLAITLADEIDHEIAQKIIHNRSEITNALGVNAHVNN